MATYLSNVRCGSWAGTAMYVTTTGGDPTRSGNTVTISNMKSVFTAYGATGADSGFWSAIYLGNTQLKRVTGITMNNGTHNYGNVSFSVSTGQTTATIQFRSSEGSSYYYNMNLSFPSGQTVPDTPTTSLSTYGAGSITISYGTASFGTAGSGTVSLYMATDSSFSDEVEVASKTTTGQSTFTVTGLSHRNTYYFRSRATSTVGNSNYSTTVGPVTPNPAVKVYGSVAGKTAMVFTPYGSVAGKTKRIVKIYGSVNGKTKLVYN